MDRILIFVLCFYLCSAKIKINRLDVPSAIQYGSQDDVILDCDFDSGGDTVTEIKWFLDGDTQIYQWLPATNTKARAIGKLKNNIDVDYKATDDESTMYRALHITNLSPDFSGNYTCKVSGPMSEDVETKRMIIYVAPEDETPDDDFFEGIFDVIVDEQAAEVTCSSGGLFPQPNMTVYIVNENETDIVFREDDENTTLTEDWTYNVTSTLKYLPDNVTQSFRYVCELEIPGTPFNVTQSWTYYREESSETQLPEDLFVFNATNSTESSFDGATESASYRHLPSLLSTLLTLTLLIPPYL